MTPKKSKPAVESQTTQPQPQATAPAATTAKVEPQPTKQMVTLDKLKAAWQERGVNLKEMTTKEDGKFMLVLVGPQWPVVKIGPTGGIDLPQIRSFSKAWDAALEGDNLLAKQQARDAKKQAATVPATAKAATPAPAAQPKKPETPAAKKQKQHAELEKAMA